MKLIVLTKGLKTLVDDDKYAILNSYKWSVASCNGKTYAKNQNSYLHHYVIGHPLDRSVVDHINGDTLDNRLVNLRIVSHRQNIMNSHKHRAGRLGGAFQDKGSKRWYARIQINGKRVYLGAFPTELMAYEAYLNNAPKPINKIAANIPI